MRNAQDRDQDFVVLNVADDSVVADSIPPQARLVADERLMAEGLKKRADVVAKVGIDEAKTAELESLAQKLAALDNEQEELKALLKTKTAELSDAQKKLRDMLGETRKLVKVAVAQSDWLTFGIGDKK